MRCLLVPGPDGRTSLDLELEVRQGPGQVATVADLVGALPRSASSPGADGLLIDGCWHGPGELLADAGLVHGSLLEPAARARSRDEPVVELQVQEGPAAGQRWSLAAGCHRLGRSCGVDLRIDDPTISRHHLQLHVTTARDVAVHDLGSRNGTVVEGDHLTPGRAAALRPGDHLEVGAFRLQLADPCPPRRSSPSPTPTGHLLVQRPPRRPLPPPPPPAVLPAPPTAPPASTPFSYAAACIPLVVGVALAFLFGPVMAVFALLSPLTIGATWWEQRRRRRRHHRRERGRLHGELERLAHDLAAAAELERRRREHLLPHLAATTQTAVEGGPALWCRRPDDVDFLRLRLGRGPVGWSPPTSEPGPSSASAVVPAEVAVAIDRASTLADCPVEIDLHHPVGIVGDPTQADAVLRSLVLQAATWHGPADLAIRSPDQPAPAWVSWLPHLDAPGSPLCLEVWADPDVPALGSARADRPAAPALVRAHHTDHLPPWCRIVVRVEATGDVVLHPIGLDGGAGERLRADGLDGLAAVEAARRLARRHDPDVASAADLPSVATLADLAPLDGRAVAAAWSAPGEALPLSLGVTAAGRATVDLVADGPHALVVGTTGAGKSELLRSIVAGLACRLGPDDVTFLLIDFKGGTAFDACRHLPHLVGLVTDLDDHLAERALTCLHAEVVHRERRMRAAGVADVAGLRAQLAPGDPPLPRLVVVVDELAVLVGELPELAGTLVDVAQRGRALGIHLVLATQRATGTVNDRIRANTNVRVALRTVDAADAVDVVGVPTAAAFDRRTPGRAVVRVGTDDPVVAQTPWSGARRRSDPAVIVRRVGTGDPDRRPDLDAGPTDLDRAVGACRDAARRGDMPAPRQMWLPPLAEAIDPHAVPVPGEVAPEPGAVAFGLLDDPAQQRQGTWWWRPSHGHLVVHGARGSGVSTALGHAAAGVSTHGGHVWQLSGTEAAGAISTFDRPAITDLVAAVGDEVARRRQGGACPTGLVVVDRWNDLAADAADLEGMRLLDQLTHHLLAGPSLGIVAAIGLDRPTGLPAALASASTQRLFLRTADVDDAGLVSVPTSAARRRMLAQAPPGRGLATPDGLEIQLVGTQPGTAPT